MDPIIMEKLKQEFQTERREQVLKGKDLQKETLQRRRAMELKAQLEAAKEEKRRQEALAERKARHIEATMRFQKGLKHFKFNKERISLEQVLRDITPQGRTRLNSADDTLNANHPTVYNNYNDPNTENYYINTSQSSKQASAQNSKLNRMRKSASFESLNSLSTLNTNSNINNNFNNKKQYVTNNMINKSNNTNNNNNNNSHTIIEQIKLTNTNILNPYNPETLTENTNFKVVTNKHQTKNIVYNGGGYQNNNYIEVYHDHKDLSKENLKDFQTLVNQTIRANPNHNFYDTQNVLTLDDYKNGLYQKHDIVGDEEELNSMDTDSLIDDEDESNNANHKTEAAHEIDINDDAVFINNNIKKRDTNKNLNSTYNSHVDASSLWFANNNNKKNTNSSNNNKLQTKQNIQQTLNTHAQPVQPSVTTHTSNTNNQRNKENSSREIKSILKRSSSLENNLTIINYTSNVNQNGNGVNFSVKPVSDSNIKSSSAGAGVKDSLDVANMRKFKKDDLNESNLSKKSVRFAFSELNDGSKMPQQQQQQQQADANANGTTTQQELGVNKTSPHVTVNNEDRISSTNSVRRPVIKTRNGINHAYRGQHKTEGDIVTTTTIITSPKFLNHNHHNGTTTKIDEFIVNSEKPPAHPNTYMLNSGGSSSSTSGGSSSYSVIGQKRRELLHQRTKLNSGGSSSCSSSVGTTSGSGSSGVNDRSINSPKTNGVNIKIDMSPNNSNLTMLPLNRVNSFVSPSPLQSPNQFFPMPISTSSQASSITNGNINNTNNNFTNSKYVEGNYREYQLSKNKELNSNNSSVPSTPNSIRINNTLIDMNLYKKLDISNYLDQQHQLNQMINREYFSNNNNNINNNNNNNSNNKQPESNTILTKIPLSPKSNLKSSNYYYPTNENQTKPTIVNAPLTHEQIILRRPATDMSSNLNMPNFTSKPPTPPNFSATPNATITQLMSPKLTNHNNSANNENNNTSKTNIRFAYINSPLSNHVPNYLPSEGQTQLSAHNQLQQKSTNLNVNNQQQQQLQTSLADNNIQKNQNTAIHLEIKYPLYSNVPTQNTQYINITKPIVKQSSFEGDSAQRNPGVSIPVSISIEEQNVKNSIMRLNERLNILQNQRFTTNNGDYLNRANFDNLSKQQKANNRPITTNISKLRR